MALRRAEDAAAVARARRRPGAPAAARSAAPRLRQRARRCSPARTPTTTSPADVLDGAGAVLSGADLLLAPQAIGGHVDHRVVVDVVAALRPDALLWRDTPYVLRRPEAPPWQGVPDGVEQPVEVARYLGTEGRRRPAATRRSWASSSAGAEQVAADLEALARQEARRLDAPGPCEVFLGASVIRP